MEKDDLAFTPAYELKGMIQKKEISVLDLTNYFYEKIDALNPKLNAFLYIDKEDARSFANKADKMIAEGIDKPLLGIPSAIPDVLHMKGTPTTFGSVALKDQIYQDDSFEIQLLKESGSVILGKTNLAEFALCYDTENNLIGPCVNPWNHEYTSGGGAGGAAVAVASGMIPFALATDFQGALRLSSSFCGVMGLLPTRGRVPIVRKHLLPFTERMFYRKGVIARNMADIAMMLNVLAKPDARDPICCTEKEEFHIDSINNKASCKIGWIPNLGNFPIENEVSETISKRVKELENLGHEIEELDIEIESDMLMYAFFLISSDRYVMIMKSIREDPQRFDLLTNPVKQWLTAGNEVTGAQYSMAITYLGILEEKINKAMEKYDFLITPTSPTAPFPSGKRPKTIKGQSTNPLFTLSEFLVPFNMSGHPALTVPCGKSSEGLPIGMQIIGRKFSESFLLSFGRQYEEAFPFPHV